MGLIRSGNTTLTPDDDYYTPEYLIAENNRYIDGCNGHNLLDFLLHSDKIAD